MEFPAPCAFCLSGLAQMPSKFRTPAFDQSIRFVRLEDIAPETIIDHMSDPHMAEHMPLLDGPWDMADYQRFIAVKNSYWQRDGLGHLAILINDDYVGWGGFQKEGDDWDYGLVLRPDCFGLGMAITRKALEIARADTRIPSVTFLLPPTRTKLGALKRIGAVFEEDVCFENQTFQKFRLQTAS